MHVCIAVSSYVSVWMYVCVSLYVYVCVCYIAMTKQNFPINFD